MRKANAQTSQDSSDSESEAETEIKNEPIDSDSGGYSPGGGDTSQDSFYVPADPNTKTKEKPYRPGGFFFDDDDEEDDEDNDAGNFIADEGEEEDEDEDNEFFAAPSFRPNQVSMTQYRQPWFIDNPNLLIG